MQISSDREIHAETQRKEVSSLKKLLVIVVARQMSILYDFICLYQLYLYNVWKRDLIDSNVWARTHFDVIIY